jgi:mannan endo-1,4-beta-mannosidase
LDRNGTDQSTPNSRKWRYSRHGVLAVGLCVLTVMLTLDSSISALATEGGAGPAALAHTQAGEPSGLVIGPLVAHGRPAVSALVTPNGQHRRTLPRALPSGSVTASVNPILPSLPQSPGAPTVTALSPVSVSAGGGALVTITGNGFSTASAVYFGPNESSQYVVVSPTTIAAIAPTNEGSVGVTVTTPLGISVQTDASQLIYTPTGQLPVTASGQSLEIDGIPTKFTGVNAYELATDWGTNHGCGGMETPAQMASLFASLAPDSIVRFWAFQGDLATNASTHEIDWAPIDQVFYLAAARHVYLIPAITDQGGTCDGDHWQDPSWYTGGYKDVYNSATDADGTGDTPISYWDYMQELVDRYKNSPALGMWEPISEAEASSCPAAYQPLNCSGHQVCPDESVAASDLTSFFTSVGGEIHALDPTHLVESGLLGGGQCGTSGADYQAVAASPGIDVLSVHDYYGSAPLGGDQWNGLAVRFAQAAALGKPIITGEAGIEAGTGPSCESFTRRASDMQAKAQAQFAAGSSAFLVWNWVLDPLGTCSYNTGPGDPLMATLAGAG